MPGGLAELDVVVEDDGDDGDGGMDFGEVDGGLDGEIGIGFEEFCSGFPEDVIDLDEMGILFSELFFVVGQVFEPFEAEGAFPVDALEDGEGFAEFDRL